MAEPTKSRFRGLVLSADELRQMTDWPDALVEDYLNLLDNLVLLADEIDIKNDIIKNTTVVTFADTPYTPLATDEEIFIDTTDGPVDITLPVGIDGTNYRLVNVGQVGNDATITPALLENLFGVNASEPLHDDEVFIMTFETDKGWY